MKIFFANSFVDNLLLKNTIMKTDTANESKADRLMREEHEAQMRAYRKSRRENRNAGSWWNNTTTWFILLIVVIIGVLCFLWL